MIIRESKNLHKEPLIIYFSVAKYQVMWLQWNIIKVTLLQFIHENTDPTLWKVQTLSSLHSHFSQDKVLNILLKKVTMQYNAMSILSGWTGKLWWPLVFFLLLNKVKITWIRVNSFLLPLFYVLDYFTVKNSNVNGFHFLKLLALGNAINIIKRLILTTSFCYWWCVGEYPFKTFPICSWEKTLLLEEKNPKTCRW